ncbi:MAG: 4-(cytidine 5'-diphospho)-2-C-methyl-D-erythritol kinase [Rhizobiales bacterium]|nr:4-(cytidine 5'-diphospho)-2-C-methyl-D-erythritol kinase [Hyphomicrobiales bacterium]
MTDGGSAPAAGAGFAAAKINLALHVTGRRADGYHELDSLVVFAEIGDSLALVDEAPTALAIDGPFASGLDDGSGNLVLRARDAVAAFAGPLPPLGFRLTKRLPVASGLGGGSADAAAALRLLAGRLAIPLDDPRLTAAAQRLGADVPMCLFSRSLHASGIGERIALWPEAPRLAMVLANPGVGVATPAVFRRLARRDGSPLPTLPPRPTADRLAAFLRAETRNDLEAPAIEEAPVIAEALQRVGAAEGCRLARMSGSGATVFGIFPDNDAADRAAQQIATERPDWWVVATQAGGG